MLQCGVAEALCYDSKCFRRGHFDDILRGTGTLKDALKAGEWNSKRFQEYLDMDSIEDAAAMEKAAVSSSSDGD